MPIHQGGRKTFKSRKKLPEKASTYTNNEMYLLRILRAAILSVPCCLCPQCISLIEGGVKILILELDCRKSQYILWNVLKQDPEGSCLSVPCCLCPLCILLIEGGVKIISLELEYRKSQYVLWKYLSRILRAAAWVCFVSCTHSIYIRTVSSYFSHPV